MADISAELGRIKGNISKMIAQNAPEPDIDSYLSSEGYSPEDVRDPIRFEVKTELNTMRKKGDLPASGGYGLGRQFIQGATMGLADEAVAGATVPLEMIKRGTMDPRKAYAYTKAREDIMMDEARQKGGLLGTGMEIGGGLVTGGNFAKAGMTAMPANPAAASFGRNLGGIAADSAAFGAVQGFGEGSGLEDSVKGAATGGAVGGLMGLGVGAAVPAVSAVGRKTLGWVDAARDPEKFAGKQVARALMESGKTPAQVGLEVSDAAAMGQPMTVADALGNPGQRMLSVVARNPGEGRTEVTKFLNARQEDQAGRVATLIEDGLGAGPTARQTSRQLMTKAAEDAEPLYQQAFSAKPVWDERIQQFLDDPITKEGLKRGVRIQRLESLAKGEKFDPTDLAITGTDKDGNPILDKVPNMRTLNVIKKGIDDILERYRDPVTKRLHLDEEGRAIEAVRKSYLSALDAVNPDYAAARKAWAGPASIDEAVDMGQYAASRGRATDNIDILNALGKPQQQGYRTGYADKTLEALERKTGGNAAIRFNAPKYDRELGALSLYQGPLREGEGDMLRKALDRENLMFQTRQEALGGSKTADNLADNASIGVSPEIVSELLRGNVMQAGKNVVARSSDALSGNTPTVRRKLAEALLRRDPNGLEDALKMTFKDEETRRKIAAQLMRGAIGGAAAGTGNISSQRNTK